ncbi:hypothetical protein C4K37_5660 [Pseudomonas chlororaphis subsp. piscium]|nr:hypothetical protein C4K37_5660 [Pseudomonas chlororaphis subsp. piscium]AZC46573.1 hypothetical protein C4K36_5679 [Pseudomonas chlororaphis subsp. piscium]
MLCLGGHEMDRLYSCNPLRRIAPSPTHAGPATASGRTYQIKSGGATPGCRARVLRCLQRSMPPGLVCPGPGQLMILAKPGPGVRLLYGGMADTRRLWALPCPRGWVESVFCSLQ